MIKMEAVKREDAKRREGEGIFPGWSPRNRIFFSFLPTFSNFPIVLCSGPSPGPNSTRRPPLLGDKDPQVSLCLQSEERKQAPEPTLGRSQRAERLPPWLGCPGAERRGVVSELPLRPGSEGAGNWGSAAPQTSPRSVLSQTEEETAPATALSLHRVAGPAGAHGHCPSPARSLFSQNTGGWEFPQGPHRPDSPQRVNVAQPLSWGKTVLPAHSDGALLHPLKKTQL